MTDADDLIQKLYDRIETWSLNDGKARVSVPLRELRAVAAELDRLHALEDHYEDMGLDAAVEDRD